MNLTTALILRDLKAMQDAADALACELDEARS